MPKRTIRIYKIKLDLKKVLDGRADPEENLTLAAGDTVIVHGNWKKTCRSSRG